MRWSPSTVMNSWYLVTLSHLVLPDPLSAHRGEHCHRDGPPDPAGPGCGHPSCAAPAPHTPPLLHPEGGSLGPKQRGRGAPPAHPAADRLRCAASLGGCSRKRKWPT